MKKSREEITTIVLETVQEYRGSAVKEPPLTLKTHLIEDLHLHTDDATEAIMAIEERTGIKPSVDDWGKVGAIGEIIELLLARTNEAHDVAWKAFLTIRDSFPQLQAHFSEGGPVDLSLILPIQSGLKYEVNLNLQNNDELHFSVSHFQLSWFPCTKPDVVGAYVEAVAGFLAGKYRIVEHHRGAKCVKAELQSPQDAGWKTVGGCSNIRGLWPWPRKKLIVVRNA